MQITEHRNERSILRLLLMTAALCFVTALPGTAYAVNQVRFCAWFNVSYWDVADGQDKLINTTEPGSKHWAEVQRAGVPVWSGYMTNNCTPFSTINPGTYTFWVTSAVSVASGKVVHVYPDTNEDWQWYSASQSVSSNPSGDSSFTKTFTAAEEAHVSLVASTMGSAELVSGTYKIYANQGCGSEGLSCFNSSVPAVFLGTIEQTGNDAFSKSVTGHEIGHFVQYRLFGTWNRDYSQNAGQTLCKCDHVDDPDDRSHCMQSREQIGAARLEAWGHAYAAGLFNTPSHSIAAFGYYKNFLNSPGNIPQDVVVPPVWTDSLATYTWMEDNCNTTVRGTEMDWTGFFYYLHNKTANAYSFANLKSTFETECGGTCSSSNDVVTWTTLTSAAASVFGAGSAKANHLNNTGDLYGVNH